jgi:hypothetical protein
MLTCVNIAKIQDRTGPLQMNSKLRKHVHDGSGESRAFLCALLFMCNNNPAVCGKAMMMHCGCQPPRPTF